MPDTVLVVDDDGDFLAMLTIALQTAGYRVVSASTARRALDLAAGDPPDIAVVDVVMPDMDGWQVGHRLREAYGIPVVFVSAYPDMALRLKSYRLGDDYVAKPVDLALLKARLRGHLLQRRAASDKE